MSATSIVKTSPPLKGKGCVYGHKVILDVPLNVITHFFNICEEMKWAYLDPMKIDHENNARKWGGRTYQIYFSARFRNGERGVSSEIPEPDPNVKRRTIPVVTIGYYSWAYGQKTYRRSNGRYNDASDFPPTNRIFVVFRASRDRSGSPVKPNPKDNPKDTDCAKQAMEIYNNIMHTLHMYSEIPEPDPNLLNGETGYEEWL